MDPIIAPVTALIPQPVGILRLSGANLPDRIRFLFPDLPHPLEHRKIYRAMPVQHGHPLDECLLLYFQSPHSFTGEDVIEIHAHGNPYNIRKLLALFHDHGIRLAKPGEFTLRAYQNHKISLLKAESLHRMISAPSYAHFQAAHHHFFDPATHPLAHVQDQFLDLLASLFTLLDHPDSEEDISTISTSSLSHDLRAFDRTLSSLLLDYRKRHRSYHGFSVLLAGHPNSGKSSLFNRFLKDNRALVSPLPGTTRDLIEGHLSFPFGDIIFLDSAGLRSSSDSLESAGIQRTRQSLSRVDCILWVSSPEHPSLPSPTFFHRSRGPVLFVWNKADIDSPGSGTSFEHVVSARTRKGISSLLDRLRSLAHGFYLASDPHRSSIESERQRDSLKALQKLIREAIARIDAQQVDLALSSLEEGKKVLDDGIGLIPSSEVYERVFKRFCLGK